VEPAHELQDIAIAAFGLLPIDRVEALRFLQSTVAVLKMFLSEAIP
jgi:hypothetical protein